MQCAWWLDPEQIPDPECAAFAHPRVKAKRWFPRYYNEWWFTVHRLKYPGEGELHIGAAVELDCETRRWSARILLFSDHCEPEDYEDTKFAKFLRRSDSFERVSEAIDWAVTTAMEAALGVSSEVCDALFSYWESMSEEAERAARWLESSLPSPAEASESDEP